MTTEIDWSKKPEGATHYREDRHCVSTGGTQYYKLDATGCFYWGENVEKGWVKCAAAVPGYSKIPDKYLNVSKWNGEGVPTVGTVCEYSIEGTGQWYECTIKYSSPQVVVFNNPTWGDQPSSQRVRFRPIRTAEQVAAEEHKAKTMEKLEAMWMDDTPRDDFLEAVYAMILEAKQT